MNLPLRGRSSTKSFSVVAQLPIWLMNVVVVDATLWDLSQPTRACKRLAAKSQSELLPVDSNQDVGKLPNLHKHRKFSLSLFILALLNVTLCILRRSKERSELVQCARVYRWLIIWVKVITLYPHFFCVFSLLQSVEREERCAACKNTSQSLPNWSDFFSSSSSVQL